MRWRGNQKPPHLKPAAGLMQVSKEEEELARTLLAAKSAASRARSAAGTNSSKMSARAKKIKAIFTKAVSSFSTGSFPGKKTEVDAFKSHEDGGEIGSEVCFSAAGGLLVYKPVGSR